MVLQGEDRVDGKVIGEAVPGATSQHAGVLEMEAAVVDAVERKKRATHRPGTALAERLVCQRVVSTERAEQMLLEGTVPVVEITCDEERLMGSHLGAQEFRQHLGL